MLSLRDNCDEVLGESKSQLKSGLGFRGFDVEAIAPLRELCLGGGLSTTSSESESGVGF